MAMRNDLEQGGRLLVQGCAMSYGFGFSPQSLRDVYDIIRNGIEKMEEKNQVDMPDKILEAQKSLIEFVSQLVTNAKLNSLTEIEEQTVRKVRIKFGPVYPYDQLCP